MAGNRPDRCQWCHCGPHGAQIKTASNGRLYVGKLAVIGQKPDGSGYGEYLADYWYDRKGKALYEAGPIICRKPTPKQIEAGLAEGLEKKDIKGDRVKLKIDAEVCAITNVGDDIRQCWLCVYCRAIFMAKRAAANAKPATEGMDPLFDMTEIDKQGEAKYEEKKKACRDMNKPIITDIYSGDVS